MIEAVARNVLDSLLEGCQVIGFDWTYLYVNDVMARHARWSREELLGHTMMECFPGIEDTLLFLALQRCMTERKHAQMENEFTYPDGAKGWFELRFIPVPEGTCILSLDVTEHKQAAAKTRVSAAKLRQILDTVPHGIVETDLDGAITFSNRAYARLHGYDSPQELIGKKIREFVAPEDRERAKSTHAETVRNQPPPAPYTGRDVTADGQKIVVQVDWDYLRDPDGELAGFISIITDITERKRVEVAIRESEDRYRKLVDGSILGVAIVQNEKTVFCNPAFAVMLGEADPGALLGKEPIANMLPADRDLVATRRESVLSGEAAGGVLQYRVPLPGGKLTTLESAAQLVEWQGQPAVQFTVHDVTQNVELRQQLESSQRLETVGHLAGGIAHDFNNILAVISAHAEFLLDALADKPEHRQDAQVVLDASARAAALTRQLLAFSRRQVLEMRLADLNEVVVNTHKLLGRVIGEDIALRTALAPDLKRVHADVSQIEQVIMNLAVNARDSMPQGGAITIETSNRTLDADYSRSHLEVQPGNYVMLAISDTGTGMDAETQSRIFEPFFTTKPLGKGTGLGLATVYGIVKQMNGSINFTSELGVGTVFKIYFPVAEDAAAEKPERAEAKSAIKPTETILLVEDEELVRRAAQRILKGAGYQVVAAATPAEAIALYRSAGQTVHLLLTDVVMPGMSGNALWQAIRKERDVPALFMSGYTDDAIVRNGILDGEVPFLAKPFSKASLLNKVREVLERGK